MLIEFVGKFYDNHSLSIVNRNLVLALVKQGLEVTITPLDQYDPLYAVDKSVIKTLKKLEQHEANYVPDIQLRHSYPPIWEWPAHNHTKVVYMQPWEYPKALFEWQYKFESFADALIVPSTYCKNVFKSGGLNPNNLFMIPHGYDDSIFNKSEGGDVSKFGINASKVNFVYVGNSQWRKGLDILLQVWAKAFSRSDNAKLIIKDNPRIYGQSNILAEIIKIQYLTDCGEIVYIDDELSPVEMADIYKASKVVVHPYRAEGFGMHVQEAIACGCVPIVSADGPTDDFIPADKGLKIGVRKNAINIADPNLFILKPGDSATMMSTHTFVNEPDPNQLLSAMKYVYHSHDREQLLSKVRIDELPNTWDNLAAQYIPILNDISGRKVNRLT
jgi:glycosyltransferase involved in cell wall biosynthesis